MSKHSREVLTQLADETGGQAYFPKTLKDVDGIAQQVAQDIRSQYMIEYHSTKPMSVPGIGRSMWRRRRRGTAG